MIQLLLPAVALAVEPPTFSVDHGVFDAPFTLTLQGAEDGATLLYGIGADEPRLVYDDPLSITGTTVVRARLATGAGVSDIVTRTYLFPADVVASSDLEPSVVGDPVYGPDLLRTLAEDPSLSIVVDGDLSSTSEAVASLEWLDPSAADGGFSVPCGARLTGYTSLGYPKQNIRLYFRSDYGMAELAYPLYAGFETGVPAADEFDALSLRSSHDSVFYLAERGQYLRNLWMDESQLEMGHLVPHGRFAHVYVNGAYRGVYHVRERFDDAFMAEYLGGDEEDYEAINAGRAVSGSGAAWAAAVAAAHDWDLVQDRIQVGNLLDYMILNFYAGNAWDWYPEQNWMSAGPEEPGQGGFRFHASDSDICLVYDWDVNILTAPGPSWVFQYLSEDAHPDFQVLLADRIHALLEGDGPLTAGNAAARYERVAALLEPLVVGESARWGGGWWERDDEWDTERQHLLVDFFPQRTAELLRQVRDAGWYPLEAPTFDVAPGPVEVGVDLEITAPAGSTAELWVGAAGEDPRLPGGDLSPGALGPTNPTTVPIPRSRRVLARLRQGTTWGPLEQGFFEVDEAPSVVLNEWNAVDPDRLLDDEGTDPALGRIPGNGGDWFELLVVRDHTDLRGWRITLQDRRGPAGDLTFTDDPLLADLRAGTLLTVAEDLPEDAALDPDRGDWRFHLRAAEGASGRYVTATAFDVSASDWQLTLLDADGFVRFGPAGEGVSPDRGISAGEVGLLAADPGPGVRRTSEDWRDGTRSTFGAPNAWDGGEQDLSALRGQGAVADRPDSAPPDDGAANDPPPEADPMPPCTCAHGRTPPLLPLLLAALLVVRRRRSSALAVGILPLVVVGCDPRGGRISPPAETAVPDTEDPPATCFPDDDGDGWGGSGEVPCGAGSTADPGDCDDDDPTIHPTAPETCDGVDDDCDGLVDDADPDLTDGLPFWEDADGDGWGDGATTACALDEGRSLQGGDCDDRDETVHPGAAETCDGVDRNCDGIAPSGTSGVAEACPADSCLAALTAGNTTSGPTWIRLPSGTTTALWCDQDTDGGGWTLGLLINSVAGSTYAGFGGSERDPAGLATSPAIASSAATAVASWLDLNALPWTTLRVGAWAGGASTYLSDEIPRTAFRIPFGQDGYLLYGDGTTPYWCGGAASYTDAGVGATNNPPGATADCKGHGSLGSGWDFDATNTPNGGLTLCGADGSAFMSSTWGGDWVGYPSAGAAQAVLVR